MDSAVGGRSVWPANYKINRTTTTHRRCYALQMFMRVIVATTLWILRKYLLHSVHSMAAVFQKREGFTYNLCTLYI